MKVSLIQLLKDWHNREKHPLVSFIARDDASHINDWWGDVWYGDFDVACVYSDKIIFAGWKKTDKDAEAPGPPHRILLAADPEFFDKLDAMLKYIHDALG